MDNQTFELIRTGIYVGGATIALLGLFKARYSYMARRAEARVQIDAATAQTDAETAKIREEKAPERIKALQALLESASFKDYVTRRIELATKLNDDNRDCYLDYIAKVVDKILPPINLEDHLE